MKNTARSAHKIKYLHKSVFLRQPLHLGVRQKYIIPIQGPIFNKIKYLLLCLAFMKNEWTVGMVWCHCLDSC